MQIERHANLLKSIFKIKNSMIFYTDKIKNSKITDVATIRFYNVETKATNWNSDKHIDVIDAKLFAIEKAVKLCANRAYSIKIAIDTWIFTGCASTITRLRKSYFVRIWCKNWIKTAKCYMK